MLDRSRDSYDTSATELRTGLEQHFHDDGWFHEAPAFLDVSAAITRDLRNACPRDPRFRAHFLGHVLTEVLLDSALLERDPSLGERYYDALAEVDASVVQAYAEAVTGAPLTRLDELVDRFRRERFVLGYVDDALVVHKIAQVARRVGLPPLPEEVATVIAASRNRGRSRLDALLETGASRMTGIQSRGG